MNLDDIVEKAIQNVWQRKVAKGDLDADLWRHNAAEMWRGLDKGLGRKASAIRYADQDFATAAALRRSVMVFAAFKNHHNTADMVDAAANAKDFAGFRDKALALNAAYNVTWLKAEYQTARASAQMAVKWNDFQANKDALPYLRFETVGDNRVRPAHRALDGTTRPVDDAFWDTWFPPLAWNCRCDVAQVAGGETGLPKTYPDEKQAPLAFRINPGKTGEIVGKDHPYYKGVPEQQRQNILKGLAKIIFGDLPDGKFLKTDRQLAGAWRASGNYPQPVIGLDEKTGGFIAVHRGHSMHALKDEVPAAQVLRDNGYHVAFLDESYAGRDKPDADVSGWIGDFKRIKPDVKDIGEKIDEYFEAWQRRQIAHHLFLHLDVDYPGNLERFLQYQMDRRNGGVKKMILIYKKKVYLLDERMLRDGGWLK